MNAAVTYDNTPDAPVFRNTYQPKDVTVDLTARKTFDNADASHAKLTDFQFQLFDNERAVGVPVQTVNADRNGDVRFQPLTFTASQLKGNKSKTFTYTVREIRQSAGGVNYDSHMGLWQITVTDDLTGRLKAQTRTNAAYPTTFTNTYQAKRSACNSVRTRPSTTPTIQASNCKPDNTSSHASRTRQAVRPER